MMRLVLLAASLAMLGTGTLIALAALDIQSSAYDPAISRPE